MKSRDQSAPTIKDIARACGVSEATVSYVINGKRVLRDETRERVRKTMREMKYHPSAVARGLSSKRMYTLGISLGAVDAVDFMSHPYASGILQGVVIESQRQGFNIALFTETWKGAAISAPKLRDGRTDGVLVVSPRLESDILESLFALNVPTVAISAETTVAVPTVDVDNYLGSRLAAQHLIELGHTRIAYLTGNDYLASYRPRLQGFLDAMKDAGIEPRPEYVLKSDFSGTMMNAQTVELLSLPEPPTAICAGNDIMGVGVIETAKAMGVDVPGRLSVVGFDDIPACQLVMPNLTTVHQPFKNIGIRATRLLVERVQQGEPEKPAAALIAPELVVRDSSTAPVG